MGRGRNVIARFCAISVLALCAGSFIEEARSEQLFVCDGGKAMRIAADQPELAKRTNPCVAQHYGLHVEVKASKKLKRSFGQSFRLSFNQSFGHPKQRQLTSSCLSGSQS